MTNEPSSAVWSEDWLMSSPPAAESAIFATVEQIQWGWHPLVPQVQEWVAYAATARTPAGFLVTALALTALELERRASGWRDLCSQLRHEGPVQQVPETMEQAILCLVQAHRMWESVLAWIKVGLPAEAASEQRREVTERIACHVVSCSGGIVSLVAAFREELADWCGKQQLPPALEQDHQELSPLTLEGITERDSGYFARWW